MSNPNIGEYDCEACVHVARKNTRAFVRQDKNGKLYGLCPRCGKVTRGNPQGQDYFLTVASMYNPEQRAAELARVTPAESVPDIAAMPARVTPAESVPAIATIAPRVPQAPVPPRAGIFDDLI